MRRTRLDRRRTMLVLAAASLLTVALLASACRSGGRGSTGMYSPAAPDIATSPPGSVTQGEGGAGSGAAPSPGETDSKSVTTENLAPEPQPSSADSPAGDAARLVIQTRSMLVRVKEVEATVARIRTLVSSVGGSIESLTIADETGGPVYRESASSEGRPLAGWVTVRVPAGRYDEFVRSAADLGKILRQSQDARDVTRQHVDLKARLENLRAEEKRLREMFDRATKVSDMLDVERELARVRGEAEALQAQIDLLENQAAMATVTFELVEPEPIVRPQGIDWGVADALTEGLRAFVATLNGMIVVVMGFAPLALVIAVVVLIARAAIRRRRGRAVDAAAEEAGTNGTDTPAG